MAQIWPEKPYVHLHDKWGNSVGSTRDWQTIPDAYDYIIFQEGGKVYAKNGRTGEIEYKADDAGDIVKKILQNNDNVHIHFTKGEFLVDPKRLFLENSSGANWVCGILIDGKTVTLTGEGIGQTILKLNPQTNTYGNVIGAKNYSYLKIADLTLDGNKSVVTLPSNPDGQGATLLTGGYNGTDADGNYKLRSGLILQNVKFQNGAEQGAYLGYNNGGIEAFANLANTYTENNDAEGLHIDSFRKINLVNFVSKYDYRGILLYGIQSPVSDQFGASNFSNIVIYKPADIGLKMWYVRHINVANVAVQGGTFGIRMDNTSSVNVNNVFLANNANGGILLEGDANSIIIEVHSYNTPRTIYLNGNNVGLVVEGVYIQNPAEMGIYIYESTAGNTKNLTFRNVHIKADTWKHIAFAINRTDNVLIDRAVIDNVSGYNALAMYNSTSNVVIRDSVLGSDTYALYASSDISGLRVIRTKLNGPVSVPSDTIFENCEGVTNNAPIPTAQPSAPVAGSMYFDTSTGDLYVYDGSAWKKVTLS